MTLQKTHVIGKFSICTIFKEADKDFHMSFFGAIVERCATILQNKKLT